MSSFERTTSCSRCGRQFVIIGTAANPGNETQMNVAFTCACGGALSTMLPGSANPDQVRIEPKGD